MDKNTQEILDELKEKLGPMVNNRGAIYCMHMLEQILTAQEGGYCKHEAGRRTNEMAIGWAFTYACNLLDRGVDPREYEISKLLDNWNNPLTPEKGE